MLDDDWRMEDIEQENEVTGRALSYASRFNFRVLDISDRRTTQLRGFVTDMMDPSGDAFIEVVDLFEDDRLSFHEYLDVSRRIIRCLGNRAELNEIKSWPSLPRYREAQLGYRMVLDETSINDLSDTLLRLKATKGHDVRGWFRLHPILSRRLSRTKDDPEKQFGVVGKILFKMVRDSGPLSQVLDAMPQGAVRIEWRAHSHDTVSLLGNAGDAVIDAPMLAAWHTWETMSVIDDLFVEQSIQSRTR